MSTSSQSIYEVFDHQKLDLLLHLSASLEDFDRVLVLVHTREALHQLTSALGNAGLRVESVHGTKKPELRDRALREFNEGTLCMLVTTDAIARTLNFPDLQNIVSYDFPESLTSYIHYMKITQAGAGKMITLATPKDTQQLSKMEGVIGGEIPRIKAEGFPYASQPAYTKPGRKKGGKSKGVQSKPLQNKKPKFKNKRGR